LCPSNPAVPRKAGAVKLVPLKLANNTGLSTQDSADTSMKTHNLAKQSFGALAQACPFESLCEEPSERSETEKGGDSKVSLIELYADETEDEQATPHARTLASKTRREINKQESFTLPLLALTNTRNINPLFNIGSENATKSYLDSFTISHGRRSVFNESPPIFVKPNLHVKQPLQIDFKNKAVKFSRTRPTSPVKPHPLLRSPKNLCVWIGTPE
jgi:hypothetical protein